MELDITNFLLKYPNINRDSDDILNPYDEDFYETLYKKKEFYDNRLKEFEEIPTEVGTLMKHQKAIAHFFSSNTLYDELLLVHEMGSGKTCSAVGAIEQIRQEGKFKGALYLAKGDALIDNFINELIFKCTDGRYIPPGYKDSTELEKVHRKKKAIRDYYDTNTFETFAKKISFYKTHESLSKWCKENFNNHIIIIDEVHNLRMKAYVEEQSDQTGKTIKISLNVYKEFWRFLHAVRDCKILLMSGTPMKDGVDEIASVMNLILPENNQIFPTGQDFVDIFFDKKGDELYYIKSEKIDHLKKLFKGRVSYLKAMQSKIKKIFFGDRVSDLEHFVVVQDFMGEFQSKEYALAYNEDRHGEHKGVYSNSRQAALFVFPDSTYGSVGFNKYISRIKDSMLGLGNKRGKKASYKYSFNTEHKLNELIKADTQDEMIDNLSQFSSKYAASIRNILQAVSENKSIFVYNEFVTGSGLILFGLILELFGFSKASGNEPLNSKKLRYASLTSETSTVNQIRLLVERFNQPDNINGKIINVIIGSRKISEGFSFKNIQVEEIQTPWFNYSETSQAIARGYRLGSHRDLLESGIVPNLNIYQRVSIPYTKDVPSIDLHMYKKAEDKDISIKGVERIMKESAWDCALFYSRNHLIGYDNQRECDYMDCNYLCDNIGVPVDIEDLDYSTFYLQYDDQNIENIIDKIILMFRNNFRLDLNTIIDNLPTFKEFEIISALRVLINDSKKITNKYGFSSYLKEENNIFFLVDSLSSVIGASSSEYYTQYPHVKEPITFDDLIEPIYINSLPEIVHLASKATSIKDIRKVMIRLPIEVREFFIEGSIEGNIRYKKMGIDNGPGSKTRELILKYFKSKYTNFDNVWVSWLLDDSEENINLRCFDDSQENGIWENCSKEYADKKEKYKDDKQQLLESNDYGYYGLYNPDSDEFCIRDVKTKQVKGNKKTSGRVCTTKDKSELISIILDKENLNIPIPTMDDLTEIDNALLDKGIATTKKMKNTLEIVNKITSKEKLLNAISTKGVKIKALADPKLSENELRRILFWCSLFTSDLCSYLHIWMDKKGYVLEDNTCGSSEKRKPKDLKIDP